MTPAFRRRRPRQLNRQLHRKLYRLLQRQLQRQKPYPVPFHSPVSAHAASRHPTDCAATSAVSHQRICRSSGSNNFTSRHEDKCIEGNIPTLRWPFDIHPHAALHILSPARVGACRVSPSRRLRGHVCSVAHMHAPQRRTEQCRAPTCTQHAAALPHPTPPAVTARRTLPPARVGACRVPPSRRLRGHVGSVTHVHAPQRRTEQCRAPTCTQHAAALPHPTPPAVTARRTLPPARVGACRVPPSRRLRGHVGSVTHVHAPQRRTEQCRAPTCTQHAAARPDPDSVVCTFLPSFACKVSPRGTQHRAQDVHACLPQAITV